MKQRSLNLLIAIDQLVRMDAEVVLLRGKIDADRALMFGSEKESLTHASP